VTLALADADWVDLAALALVGLFLTWGALRGALRQALGLVALALGFLLAGWLSPRLVGSMRKVVTLSPEGLACASWWTVLLGTLVISGVVIHSLRARIDRVRVFGRADPWFGGLVGIGKGVVAFSLALYAVLGWYVGERGPAVVAALRESRAARAVERLGDGLRPALTLPRAVASRVDDVNATIGPVPARPAPREGAAGPASSEGNGPR
jgi:uncharacterized membrane protein required for colicin V production